MGVWRLLLPIHVFSLIEEKEDRPAFPFQENPACGRGAYALPIDVFTTT